MCVNNLVYYFSLTQILFHLFTICLFNYLPVTFTFRKKNTNKYKRNYKKVIKLITNNFVHY